jgi:hypothetical protein
VDNDDEVLARNKWKNIACGSKRVISLMMMIKNFNIWQK